MIFELADHFDDYMLVVSFEKREWIGDCDAMMACLVVVTIKKFYG